MPKIDWSEDGGGAFQPGIHYVEVRKCEQRTSKKSGDDYFNVDLFAIPPGGGAPEFLCNDIIMLAGKGRYFGNQKLRGLGFSKEDADIEASDLKFRRAFVEVGEEVYTDEKGEHRRLKVDVKSGDFCGYWLESNPPPGHEAAPAVSNSDPSTWPKGGADDTPF